MCKISGKPVHDLWNSVRSLRLTLWQSIVGSVWLWVNSALSTALHQVDPQSYPQVFFAHPPLSEHLFYSVSTAPIITNTR